MAFHHSPQICTDGLVLLLDAANSKSYPGSGTAWNDLSGQGNVGTLSVESIGTAESGVMTLGPTTSINCGSDSSLDLTSEMTLITWVYANTLAANGYILAKQAYIDGYILHYDAAYEGEPDGGIQTTNVGNTQWEWGTNITVSQWYQIAYTYNGTLESGYHNNILVGTNATTGAISTNASYDLGIGAVGASGGLDCKVGVVQIYNRTLTQQEITQNYNALKGRFSL
jgi:hypothetical protein